LEFNGSNIMKEYTITLEQDELEILMVILEDTLHEQTTVASIEDAVLRGVLKQIEMQRSDS